MHVAPIFEELRCLSQELSSEQFSVILMLGLFWHQGPYHIRFAEVMVEFEVCRTREVVNTVLDFVAERGYIQLVRVHSSRRVCFVHPNFTIYCKAFLEHLCRHTPLGHDTRQTSATAQRRSLILSYPESQLRVVVGIYTTIDHRGREVPEGYLNHSFLASFIESVDYQLTFQMALLDDATDAIMPFRVQQDPLAKHFLNALTCFALCLDVQRNLAPENWPLDYFTKFPAMVMSAGTAAEAALFAEQFQNLLSRLLLARGDAIRDVTLEV